MSGLIVPGHSQQGSTRHVPYVSTEPVLGADGRLYEMRVEGTAEVTRGPLGRFVDLAAQIEAEGLTVPARIADAIAAEQETPS